MKTDIKHPHNNFFLRQFSDRKFALSFFRDYLPLDIVQHIDWKTFRLAPSDFINRALKNKRSDLLYETRLKKQKCFFYLHLEHQRKSEPDMVFRILYYWFNIMDQHRHQHPDQPLPLIFPLVLYQGQRTWSATKELHQYLNVPDFMRPYTPQFRYEVIDLSHLSDDEIQGELLIKTSLLVMKHINAAKIEELFSSRVLELFQELFQKKTGLEHIETILYYLFAAGRNLEKEEVIHLLQDLPEKQELEEVVMTIAERWIAEGMERGIEKGMERGIEKGMERGIERGMEKGRHMLVMKQLQFKFREKATPYLALLSQLSPQELELIAERILTMNEISSVFSGIGK